MAVSKSAWLWYGVKLLFRSTISGQPEPDTVDQNYTDTYQTIEESIILVRAQSFNHAYKIAEKKACERETEYSNPYGQTVHSTFMGAIDCFRIYDEALYSGMEVYSRLIRVPKQMDTKEFIGRFYPETDEDKSGNDYYFVLRYGEFNRNPELADK